jgi:hypothetical protein
MAGQGHGNFSPSDKFEFCLDKITDYCYAYGNGRYPKTELDSGIAYLTETKD